MKTDELGRKRVLENANAQHEEGEHSLPKMFIFQLIKALMMKKANYTIELRNALMKRWFRFQDDESLTKPESDPLQWLFKGCNRI